MPTTPYAKLLVRVNGGAPTSGGIDVVVGDTIDLLAESTVGWGSPAPIWEIYGIPPGFTVPAGWSEHTVGTETVYRYTGLGPPPQFTVSVWGKYMPALRVNGGGGQLTDEATALRAPSPSGLHDLGTREGSQFGGSFGPTNAPGWQKDQQANLRILDGAASGGVTDVTGTAPIVVTGLTVKNVAITAATGAAAGSMSATDKAQIDAATPNPTPGSLNERGASGESGFGYVWVGSSVTAAGEGQYRAQNNSIAFAAYSSTAPNYVEIAATDGLDNVLIGPESLGAMKLRTPSGTKVTLTTLTEFHTVVKLPDVDPSAEREFGADADGRQRAFIGAITSAVYEIDVTTLGTASKIVRRGASAQVEAAWFQAGADAAVPPVGHVRLPDEGIVTIKGASATIKAIEHDPGTNEMIMMDGADRVTFRAPVFMLDGASIFKRGAVTPDVTTTKIAAYTAKWDETVRVDPSGGTFIVTLTTAAGNAGRCAAIVNVTDSPVAVTIDGAGTETINGATTVVMAEPRWAIVLQSDGTNVQILAKSSTDLLVWGAESIGSTATTRYLAYGYATATATTGVKVTRNPYARVLSRITYAAGAGGTGTGSATFTLYRRIAGVVTLTTITITVLVTATTGVATFTPIVLAADDEIGIECTQTGTVTASPTDIQIAVS